MRQLERYWRPWRNPNRGSTRARWRRLAGDPPLDLPAAGSAAMGAWERLDPWDARSRPAQLFHWLSPVADDEPEPA